MRESLESRARYERRTARYPTDLTDEEWCVEEPDKPQTARDVRGAEICAAPARHGVNCIAENIKPSKRGEPGAELLAQVGKHNCDLLVMGCYGRSRLREFILGGASRHVLQLATVPVLMAY